MIRIKYICSVLSAHIFVLKSLHDNELRFILPFAAGYITFCRKMVLYRADLQIVTQIFAS